MQLDHVELFVPSRWEAAKWYERVLGFGVVEEHVDWATEWGPLMISNDGGATKIALFRGPAQEDSEVSGLRRLAFRSHAEGFLRFIDTSGEWRTPPLSRSDVEDYRRAFSVYFQDPYGTLLEVTTYDYEAVRAALAS
jgi:catechol 2,3-dioxygenase-like lactoylglutathione lyase family enzyme